MRIIAGAWRGRPIEAPPGRTTRPTSDRAREGLFSMLQSRLGTFEDLAVADLFAGTGALGLEALSRGAATCLFVEKDRAAADALRRTLDRLGASDRADLRVQGVESLAAPSRPLDVILIDPPYRSGLAGTVLASIGSTGWLAPGGWVSLEVGQESPEIPDTLELAAERKFGKARILLLRPRRGEAQPG